VSPDGLQGLAASTWNLPTLRRELAMEVRIITIEAFANRVLASDFMPRLARFVGYRMLGIQTRSPSIFAGLRLAGQFGNIVIGPRTFLNRECYLESVGPITIGRDCQFGPQVAIITSHHPWTEEGRVSATPIGLPVVIGDRVWLGARSMVLPGVTIGDDVAIAAGAVVTKDCRRPGLYAGVPARWIGPAGNNRSATKPRSGQIEDRDA